MRARGRRDRGRARASCGSATAGRSTSSTGCAARARRRGAARRAATASSSALFAAPLPAPRARPRRRGARRRPRACDAAHDALARAARARRAPAARALDARARCTTLLERARPCASARTRSPTACRSRRPEAIRARRFEAVFVCGLQEGEFPRGAAPEPFLPDDDRRALATAIGLRAAAARGPARPRALPLLRLRLARRAAAGAERRALATRRATRRSPSFFLEDVRDLFGELPGARARSLSDVTWDARRRRRRAAEWERALALRGPRVADRRRPAAAAPSRPCSSALAERDAVSASALERFADCPVKWLVDDLLRPTRSSPIPSRWCAAATPTRCWSAPTARLREETGAAAGHAREPRRRRSAILLEALREQQARVPALAEADARARGGAAARVRPAALPAPRGRRRTARFEPEHLELAFGSRRRGAGSSSATACSVRGKIDRVDVWDGHGARARLQERQARRRLQGRAAGSREPRSRRRSTCSSSRELLGLRAGGRRLRAARRRGPPAARAGARRTCDGRSAADFVDNDRRDAEEFDARARLRRASAVGEIAGEMRARRAAAVARTPAPGAAAARTPRSAGARTDGRAGVHRRAARRRSSAATASLLVRAGRGQRARRRVLVERFVRGGARGRACAVDADPRDHVHREGGGRAEGARAAALPRARASASRRATPRARGSRRSTASARACCARTRSAAGHRPRVPRARRARRRARSAIDAFDRALEEFLRDGERPRAARAGRRLHARTSCARWSRTALLAAAQPRAARARAAGADRAAAPAGERARGWRPRRSRPRCASSGGRGAGKQVHAAHRERSSAARTLLGAAAGAAARRARRLRRAWRVKPGEREGAARTRRARRVLDEALDGLRRRSARPHRAVRSTTRCCASCSTLLRRAATTRLKRGRSALDFEDLELLARDLLAADPAIREPLRASASRTCWSTSSRTRTRCRTSCSSCSRATTCSASATSTSRSTASATPT